MDENSLDVNDRDGRRELNSVTGLGLWGKGAKEQAPAINSGTSTAQLFEYPVGSGQSELVCCLHLFLDFMGSSPVSTDNPMFSSEQIKRLAANNHGEAMRVPVTSTDGFPNV